MSNQPVTSPAPAPAPSHSSRIHGCLLGGALGDSLGYAVVLDNVSTIRGKFGQRGLQGFAALDAGTHFSGATQLALYTVDGLLEALEWANSGVGADTNACLWLAYLRWLATQGVGVPEAAPFQPPRWIDSHDVLKHRRTPGDACLSGLATGEMGTYFRPVNPESNDGGPVTRSAPLGLIPYIAAADVYKLSADAASLTHGHPAARQSAGVFSLVIHALVAGQGLRAATGHALGELQAGPLRKGETIDPILVARLDSALRLSASGVLLDPEELLSSLGDGRLAEEALALGLYAVLATAPDPASAAGTPEEHFRAAISVAVNHSGDSDATASIAGNILGAFYGEDCLPAQWLEALEAPAVIRGLATRLAAATGP